MKLVDLSVTNYRSITNAHKITLQNLTVLVGKNNEGKSNLLTALNVAMTTLLFHCRSRDTSLPYNRIRQLYNWERVGYVSYIIGKEIFQFNINHEKMDWNLFSS